jgi:hypothetical protein
VATWGDGALSLLGCEVEANELIPGEQAWVRCRWRPERELSESWKLAVHIKIGSRTGKEEWTPFMGVHKMWTWQPGWSIDDTFRVKVPLYSKEGQARISLGWTRIGGLAVKTDGGKERIDVAAVTVVPRLTLETAGREGLELPARAPWPESFSLPELVEADVDHAGSGKGEGGDLDDDPPVVDDRDGPEDKQQPTK